MVNVSQALKNNIKNSFREYLAWEYINFSSSSIYNSQKGIQLDFYNFIKETIIGDGKWLLQEKRKLLVLSCLLDRLADSALFTSRGRLEELTFFVGKLIQLMTDWPQMIPTLIHCLCHFVEQYSSDKNDAKHVIENVERIPGWPESISNVKFELISAREKCRCRGHSPVVKIIWLIHILARSLPLPHVVKVLQNVVPPKSAEQSLEPLTETLTTVDLASFPPALNKDELERTCTHQNQGFTCVKKKWTCSSVIKSNDLTDHQSLQENINLSEAFIYRSFPFSNNILTARTSVMRGFTVTPRGIVKHSNIFVIPPERECSSLPVRDQEKKTFSKKRKSALKRTSKNCPFTEGRFHGKSTYGLRMSSQKNTARHKRQSLRLKRITKKQDKSSKCIQDSLHISPGTNLPACLAHGKTPGCNLGASSVAKPIVNQAELVGNKKRPSYFCVSSTSKSTFNLARFPGNENIPQYSMGNKRTVIFLSDRKRFRPNVPPSTSSAVIVTRPIDLMCDLLEQEDKESLQKNPASKNEPKGNSLRTSECLPLTAAPLVSVASTCSGKKNESLTKPLCSLTNKCVSSDSSQLPDSPLLENLPVVPELLESLQSENEEPQDLSDSVTEHGNGDPSQQMSNCFSKYVSAVSAELAFVEEEDNVSQKPSDAATIKNRSSCSSQKSVPALTVGSVTPALVRKNKILQRPSDSLEVSVYFSSEPIPVIDTSTKSPMVEKKKKLLKKPSESTTSDSSPKRSMDNFCSSKSVLLSSTKLLEAEKNEPLQNPSESMTRPTYNDSSLQTLDHFVPTVMSVTDTSTCVRKKNKFLEIRSDPIMRHVNDERPSVISATSSAVGEQMDKTLQKSPMSPSGHANRNALQMSDFDTSKVVTSTSKHKHNDFSDYVVSKVVPAPVTAGWLQKNESLGKFSEDSVTEHVSSNLLTPSTVLEEKQKWSDSATKCDQNSSLEISDCVPLEVVLWSDFLTRNIHSSSSGMSFCIPSEVAPLRMEEKNCHSDSRMVHVNSDSSQDCPRSENVNGVPTVSARVTKSKRLACSGPEQKPKDFGIGWLNAKDMKSAVVTASQSSVRSQRKRKDSNSSSELSVPVSPIQKNVKSNRRKNNCAAGKCVEEESQLLLSDENRNKTTNQNLVSVSSQSCSSNTTKSSNRNFVGQKIVRKEGGSFPNNVDQQLYSSSQVVGKEPERRQRRAWTLEEEERLVMGVMEHGPHKKKWNDIAIQYKLGNRKAQQLHDKWRSILKHNQLEKIKSRIEYRGVFN